MRKVPALHNKDYAVPPNVGARELPKEKEVKLYPARCARCYAVFERTSPPPVNGNYICPECRYEMEGGSYGQYVAPGRTTWRR